jgi:hypothetical protein
MNHWLALGAAMTGAAGTLLLYLGSFAFVQLGGFFVSDEVHAQAKRGNARRRRLQRAGLICLMLSFLLQGVVVFV